MPISGLMTGPIGAGKTTVCQRVVDLVRKRGFSVGGIVTPAIYDQSGEKTGIAIIDLGTTERRVLAHLDHGQPGLKVGKYRFDPMVLQWGREALDRAAAGGRDLFLVDEIGPLELVDGQGFTRALTVLETGILPRTIVVVRPSLLALVHQRATECLLVVFYVTDENRETLPYSIADQLFLGPT